MNKPTVLEFKNHHNYNNKFIIPSFTETQNILKKPTRYSEENKFDIFKHFGSVSELKDIGKEDPTYITRIQGLHNLRKTTGPVGRSLNSVLKKMFSRNKRETDDDFILKRPEIFENLGDDILKKSEDPKK